MSLLLLRAIQCDDIDRIRCLIKQGQHIIPPSSIYYDCFVCAARMNNLCALEELLSAHKITSQRSEQMYGGSVRSGSYSILEYGFEHLNWDPNHTFSLGANNYVDYSGKTPLDLASTIKTITFLVRHGARDGGGYHARKDLIEPMLNLILFSRRRILPVDLLRRLHSYLIDRIIS